MRIVGGMAGGRVLRVPKGLSVRPTPDLVKQAIFNSLGERVAGARVLELFAGSGALGLECLSRGAIRVTAIEKSPRHAAFIRQNLVAAGLPADAFELRTQDVFAAIRQLAAAQLHFDLVLADPPFGEKNLATRSHSLSQQLLDDPSLPALIEPDGLFVLGHTKRDSLTMPADWVELKVLRHGDSLMRLLQRRLGAEPPPAQSSMAP